MRIAIILALIFATGEDIWTGNYGDLIFDMTLLGNLLLPARYIENVWRRKL